MQHLHTLKPDASSLQRSEVYYGSSFEVWLAHFKSARLIRRLVRFKEAKGNNGAGVGPCEYKQLVFMCTLCGEQTGEWSPICEMEKIHGRECEEERCAWKPQ